MEPFRIALGSGRITTTGGRGRRRRRKLHLIEQQRIASHIADCSLAIERINKEIHRLLIPLIDFVTDVYKRVRRLQTPREIMLEHMRLFYRAYH